MHHAHAIHPLQMTMEDLLDELLSEYRNAKESTVLTGKNIKRLPIVSAYLYRRMKQRERSLILFSPMMKRVLLKLLTMRMFMELVMEKQVYLRCPQARSRALEEERHREKQEDQFFAGEPWDSFQFDKGEDPVVDDGSVSSVEDLDGFASADSLHSGPAKPDLAQESSESWAWSSSEESDFEVHAKHDTSSDEEGLFIDMDERIKRRVEQLRKEDEWRKEKEAERKAARKAERAEKKRLKREREEAEAKKKAEEEELKRKQEEEELKRKQEAEISEERRQSMLEEQKIQQMQQMAEQRKQYLEAERQRKAKEQEEKAREKMEKKLTKLQKKETKARQEIMHEEDELYKTISTGLQLFAKLSHDGTSAPRHQESVLWGGLCVWGGGSDDYVVGGMTLLVQQSIESRFSSAFCFLGALVLPVCLPSLECQASSSFLLLQNRRLF